MYNTTNAVLDSAQGYFSFCLQSAGADSGFQVRGGHLKKIAPSGGRREHFWGISCEKSRFYANKSYFFPILGPPPPLDPPLEWCVLKLGLLIW
jgi:hypothetical protein